MEELALHVLDIAENSVRAGASLVEIEIGEESAADTMKIRISDNGRGIPPFMLAGIFDPFVTSRTERRVGLGLPFFRQAARQTGGDASLTSTPGKGTTVVATFGLSHPDRQPMGDLGSTVASLLAQEGGGRLVLVLSVDSRIFTLDSREFEEQLGEDCFEDGMVLKYVADLVNEKREEIQASP